MEYVENYMLCYGSWCKARQYSGKSSIMYRYFSDFDVKYKRLTDLFEYGNETVGLN